MKYLLALLLTVSLAPAQDMQKMNLPDAPVGFRQFPAPKPWPANHGDAVVCWWEGDKDGAMSVTIDDNHVHQHSFWKTEGERLGFRFTWFAITGGLNDAGWNSFRDLVANGHDVQSHTINHLGSGGSLTASQCSTEYLGSITKIEQEIPGHRCLTMAYPNGLGVEEEAAKYFVGVRGVYGRPNQIGKIWYMNTNSSHFNDDFVDRVAVRGAGGLDYSGWLSIHIHTTAEDGGNEDVVRAHLDHAKSLEATLWFGKWKDVARYGQSRDTHTLTMEAVIDEYITYALTDSMHDGYYDYPLTVKVRIDNGWSAPVATQGAADCELTVIENAGNKYALVSTVPDGGTVILAKDATVAITINSMNSLRPVALDAHDMNAYDLYGRKADTGTAATGMYLMYDGSSILKALMK